jgi:hypothetical protein
MASKVTVKNGKYTNILMGTVQAATANDAEEKRGIQCFTTVVSGPLPTTVAIRPTRRHIRDRTGTVSPVRRRP